MPREPLPYGQYESYGDPPGFGRFAERAVFDYSDRHDTAGYADRTSRDSASGTDARRGFSLPVVDYNHGSILAASTGGQDTAEKEQESVPRRQDVAREETAATGSSTRDVDHRDVAAQRDESRRRSPEPAPAAALDAEVDIKFIQDTIVSICSSTECTRLCSI